MRIAIDIRKIDDFGAGAYIWNLVRNLAPLDTQNEYLLIGSSRNFHELGPLPPNFTHSYQPEPNSFWRDHCSLPLNLRKRAVDVFHVPHHECPILVPSKLVVTVHDCVHLLFPPEDASRFRNYRVYLHTKKVIQAASHVVAVSNSTKNDLINIFNVDASKVSVIYNALDDRFASTSATEDPVRVLERYQLNDPFILYSGRIRPHKNLQRLIEAFAVLKSELADDDHLRDLKVIIIGDELSKHQHPRLTARLSGVPP